MNKAHSTHFSRAPDLGIEHVLRGWNPAGGPAHHDLTVGDVRVRNVSTNIRDYAGGTEFDGNSIFVFETTQLCIAHLGHLHHTLSPEHLRKLGRIDVLLVPVDGGYTMQAFDMMEVLKSINAPLMLPMHYFNASTLERFLAQAREHYRVVFSDKASLTVSRESLPKQPNGSGSARPLKSILACRGSPLTPSVRSTAADRDRNPPVSGPTPPRRFVHDSWPVRRDA